MDNSHTPLAIIGVGVHLPYAQNFEALSRINKAPDFTLFDYAHTKESDSKDTWGHQFGAIEKNIKQFGIPPIFRKAICSESFLALKAVEDALSSSDRSHWNRDKVDIFCGTCLPLDTSYNNAIKMGAINASHTFIKEKNLPFEQQQQYIDRIKTTVKEKLGATSHDKIGEMASSIPARIANYLDVAGKCQTLDAFDNTGLALIQLAEDTLAHSDSDIAILTTVQQFNSPLLNEQLAFKGFENSKDYGFSEGAICLIVKPFDKAMSDDDHIIACLSSHPFRTGTAIDENETNSIDVLQADKWGFGLANHHFLSIVNQLAKGQYDIPLKGVSSDGAAWQLSLKDRDNYSDLHYTVTEQHQDIAEPIAIVGYSPFVSSCTNIDEMWDKINQPDTDIRQLPNERFNQDAFFRSSASGLSCYIDNAAYLEDLHKLDGLLPFPIMPAKSSKMDPVQKMALISCAKALVGVALDREKMGVIIGSNLCLSKNRSYATQSQWGKIVDINADIQDRTIDKPNLHQLDGMLASGTAHAISKYFNLNAQCSAVEAACASSIAALHNSVRALQSRRLDTVITGGFELPCNEIDLVMCSAQMMLSPTKITPFSQHADGFTPGDGGAIFVLKRLSDAQKAKDDIKGIIKGVSGSCDAKSMTAPDEKGQSLAMKKCLQLSGIDPIDIQYIEAHGTGTILGDQTEIKSLQRIYQNKKRKQPLYIGSAKSHFGHCFAGSGSIGLSKLLMGISHRVIPPTPIIDSLNVSIDLDAIPACINQKPIPWNQRIQNAALNSFGTGGINYHLIISREV